MESDFLRLMESDFLIEEIGFFSIEEIGFFSIEGIGFFFSRLIEVTLRDERDGARMVMFRVFR